MYIFYLCPAIWQDLGHPKNRFRHTQLNVRKKNFCVFMQKGPIHTAHRLTSPQKVEAIENLPHIFIDSFQTCLEKKLLRFKSVDNHAYSWQYCCTNIKYRGFLPYATFGTWKKVALAKNCISKISILYTQ